MSVLAVRIAFCSWDCFHEFIPPRDTFRLFTLYGIMDALLKQRGRRICASSRSFGNRRARQFGSSTGIIEPMDLMETVLVRKMLVETSASAPEASTHRPGITRDAQAFLSHPLAQARS